MDLRNKRFAILGLQGSGKTESAKWILKNFPSHLVYDVLREYDGFNRYIPKYRQYGLQSLEELNLAVNKLVIENEKRPAIFIMDEANRYCPSKRPLPDAVLALNDWSRHLNISFGVIARRPVQLNTDLIELAHNIIIFNLKGKNDVEYFNSFVSGLGDQLPNLPKFHFIVVDEHRNYEIYAPVRI